MVVESLNRLLGKPLRNFLRSNYTRSAEMNSPKFQSAIQNVYVKNYNEAIEKLNTLQSNLEAIRNNRIKRAKNISTSIPDMWRFLSHTGISAEDLKKLSVIHISGTKGKGSTAAFCDSILRSYGYRTGFYSSPHLVLVTERIRLQGTPIDKEKFVHYFNKIYRELYNAQEFNGDMPNYYCFLTVLAFHVFLNENIDVAVVEVGIGGLHDYTNVLNNVVAAGVTSLGLDHTAVLGNTIESIAFQKAGIMKTGCTAFTVDQPKSALSVLQDFADQTNCILYQVPKLSEYIIPSQEKLKLPIESDAYKSNISLAIQLAHCWMRKNKTEEIILELPTKTIEGIRSCSWPGRFQKFEHPKADYFLDGAHTKESIDLCVEWFNQNIDENRTQILVFNITGDRTLENLVESLTDIDFSYIVFMPNVAYEDVKYLDASYCKGEIERQVEKCREYTSALKEFLSFRRPELLSKVSFQLSRSAEGTIKFVSEISMKNGRRPQVLVTGSLHLVGVMLTVLDPDLGR